MLRSLPRLLVLLIAADFLFLILHFLFGPGSDLFHLDREQNLPTYYQGVKLITFGIIGFGYLIRKKVQVKQLRYFLIALSAILVFIGIDEIFQLHENTWRLFAGTSTFLDPANLAPFAFEAVGFQSSLWLVYYLPFFFIGLIWLVYWLLVFKRTYHTYFKYLITATVFGLMVVIFEVLSSTGWYPPHVYHILVGIEETSEKLAATVLGILVLKIVGHPASLYQLKIPFLTGKGLGIKRPVAPITPGITPPVTRRQPGRKPTRQAGD
jgi:hypothetical protein